MREMQSINFALPRRHNQFLQVVRMAAFLYTIRSVDRVCEDWPKVWPL